MSKNPIDHAVNGTMPPLHELSLEDEVEEPAHHDTQAESPLRIFSSAGTAAKDITTKFRAATSGKLALLYFHEVYAHNYSSRDWTACQGCLLYTFRIRWCVGGTT